MGFLFRAGSVGIDRLVGCDAGGVCCIVERRQDTGPSLELLWREGREAGLGCYTGCGAQAKSGRL